MDPYKISPRRLIIDLMRISDKGSIAIKSLILAGGVFAFNESLIRVTITRLVREGVVESSSRGVYCLADKGRYKTEYVQAWREGEARVVPWDHSWVSVHLPKNPNRNDRKKSLHILDLLGFREVMDYLWMRPNNLAGGLDVTRDVLGSMGLECGASIFSSKSFDNSQIRQWVEALWTPTALIECYKATTQKLESSESRFKKLDLKQALLESFVTGSQAIHVLATDPMLPSELMDVSQRERLWSNMLRYDQLGREIWSQFPIANQNLVDDHNATVRRVK